MVTVTAVHTYAVRARPQLYAYDMLDLSVHYVRTLGLGLNQGPNIKELPILPMYLGSSNPH